HSYLRLFVALSVHLSFCVLCRHARCHLLSFPTRRSSDLIQKFFRDEDLLESGLYSSELTHLEAIRVAVRTDDENLRNRIDAIFDSSFITTVPIDTQVKIVRASCRERV